MEILNIGPFELLLIGIIALSLLGPRGMIRFLQKAGSLIRKIVQSPIWKDILSTSKEIRALPQKLAHEADLEAEFQEFKAWREQTKGLQNEIQSFSKDMVINSKNLTNSVSEEVSKHNEDEKPAS
jgi:Sec-independent protein translocase protein TatA